MIDISVPLAPGMPTWPGEPGFTIDAVKAKPRTSRITLGTHSGTHIDAPRHVFLGDKGVEQAPLDALLGPCLVLDCPTDGHIAAADLPEIPRGCRRLLLRTANSRHGWPAGRRPPVGLRHDAAQALARQHLRLVGFDHLSIAAPDEAAPVHETLLGMGTWILEGIDLGRVEPGEYDLACLPLRIPGADGAPARAALRRLA